MATSLNGISSCKEPHEMARNLLEGKITLGYLRPTQLLEKMYVTHVHCFLIALLIAPRPH